MIKNQDKVIIYKGRKKDVDEKLYVKYQGEDLKKALEKFNKEEKKYFNMYVSEGSISSMSMYDMFKVFEDFTTYINGHSNKYYVENIEEVKRKLDLLLRVLYVDNEIKGIDL